MDIARASTLFIANQGLRNLVVAEIGVRAGENALSMFQYLDIQRLYLVDHYPEYTEGSRHFSQTEQLGYWMTMFRSLKPYQGRTTLIHQPSIIAAPLFSDGALDFVYIDADHTKNSVYQDMTLWWGKVKAGGYMAGHDYHPDWPGVIEAVRVFTGEKGLEFNKIGLSDWLISKKQ